MAQASKPLKGYVRTSNMYLIVLMTLSIGFLGGVLFSVYRSTSFAPPTGGMPATGPAAPGAATPGAAASIPLTNEQMQTLKALEEATRTTPDNVKAWTQLGHLYFDTGKFKKAIMAYEKSLALDGTRPDVWTDLGVMYRRTDNPKKAIESFDRALSLNNRHEVANFNKGIVFMHDLKDTKSAVKAWETLLEINPVAVAPNGQPVSSLVDELKKQVK